MGVSQSVLDTLAEMLAPLGPVSVRRMFGGAGIHHAGRMFAIVADDVLYLKANADTRPDFERLDLAPFSFATHSGKTTVTSYWRAPDHLLDDPDELLAWARRAVAARATSVKSAKPRIAKAPPRQPAPRKTPT